MRVNLRSEAAERARKWRVENPERASANDQRYLRENHEEIMARKRIYVRANHERIAAYQKHYRETHREERAAYDRKREAAKHGCEGSHSAADVDAQFERQQGRSLHDHAEHIHACGKCDECEPFWGEEAGDE